MRWGEVSFIHSVPAVPGTVLAWRYDDTHNTALALIDFKPSWMINETLAKLPMHADACLPTAPKVHGSSKSSLTASNRAVTAVLFSWWSSSSFSLSLSCLHGKMVCGISLFCPENGSLCPCNYCTVIVIPESLQYGREGPMWHEHIHQELKNM